MKTLVGFRPTGPLHLGHYFSVIHPAQQDMSVTVLVADLHVPGQLSPHDLWQAFGTLQSYGIDPRGRAVLQSSVSGLLTRYFQMLSIVTANELRHMIQFKVAAKLDDLHENEVKQVEGAVFERKCTAHLLCYPILQAVDCMGYDKIIVGKDQSQHIDYARNWIKRFNSVYNSNFPIPELSTNSLTVKDLRNSSQKMSNSNNPEGTIYLNDYPEDVDRKLKKAVMDEEGVINLRFLYRYFINPFPPDSNSQLKTELSAYIIKNILRAP